jgi:enoyl-CoA hydratase/carnithine racemase
VVLTGAGGKAFRVGRRHFQFESERSSKDAIDRYNAAGRSERTRRSTNFPSRLLRMIRGYCIGGGVGLALCCDLRICSDNSKFGVPCGETRSRLRFQGIKKLVDVVGPSFAKEIFFTARQFTPRKRCRWAWSTGACPDAEVEKYVKDYAETISGNAPLTVNSVKYIVGEVVKDESKRNLKRCDDLVAQCFASKDYIEGRKAFMEKRKPAFTGS